MSTRPEVEEVERVPWAVFRRDWFTPKDWPQGAHIGVLGTPGGGKTTLVMKGILPMRIADPDQYIVILDVKGDDPSLRDARFKHIRDWPPRAIGPKNRLFRLHPPAPKRQDLPRQYAIFRRAMDDLYTDHGWTIVIDEVRVMAGKMKLDEELIDLWVYGRSRKLTIVGVSQYPRWIPKEMYQATQGGVFIFPVQDEDARKRLGEIGGDTKRIREAVASLDTHDFLYIADNGRSMVISSWAPSSTAAPRSR